MTETKFRNIAMLSTHGFFDPVPQLGITDTGGQVVYVLELAKAISKLNIKVDIYTRWFDKSKKQIDPVPGFPDVRIIRIPAGPWNFIPKEKIYEVLPELSENMIDFIKEKNINYDLFHGHYVDAGIVTVKVAKALNKPSYFTAHSLGEWKREQMGGKPDEMEKKFNFHHRIAEEVRIFKTVNAQSVTSKVQKEKLNKLYNYFADNIVIIPPGVDVHTYTIPDKNKEPIKTTLPEKYIFCLSRIDTNKGHDLLLNAFDLVRKEVNDIYLVIGGGSPNPKPRELSVFEKMHKIIDKKGLKDKVRIIGYVSDELMLPYYQQSQLFVLPSLFEPFGMTTQEAMACGKPVVASKFGGIRNVINNGKNGLLVDPSNPKEFAKKIIKLLNDEKYRENIGTEAYKTIQKYYSWEAIANRFLKFYKDFISYVPKGENSVTDSLF